MIALNRSFIYAGAKNVLFSLWKVNDKYSSELMIKFYQQHFVGQAYQDALRTVKLQLMENEKTVLLMYWTPFALIGQ